VGVVPTLDATLLSIPLLRLNLEAPTREQCDNEVATLLQLITA